MPTLPQYLDALEDADDLKYRGRDREISQTCHPVRLQLSR
jgi:hypothetical protein